MRLHQIAFHRNGVSGAPFHAIIFKDTGKKFLATVFDEPGALSVICLDMIEEYGVSFGANSWRGDNYEPTLRRWIEEARS